MDSFFCIVLFIFVPLVLVQCDQNSSNSSNDTEPLPKKSITNVIHIYEKRLLNFVGRYDLNKLTDMSDPHWPQRPIFHTANLDDWCDMTIQTEFIEPIYKTRSREDEHVAVKRLIDHLDAHPSLANVSCFGLMAHSRGRYYNCEQRPGKSHPACYCKHEEPWIYNRVPKSVDSTECKLLPSALGDPCDHARMKEFNKTLFEPHFEAMKQAGKQARKIEKALEEYGKKFKKLVELNLSPADARRACLGITTNMECKEDNKCGCLDVLPYYSYEEGVLRGSGKYCLGKRNSLCLFEPKTKEGVPILIRSAHCHSNMGCKFPEVLPEGTAFDYDAVHVCGGPSLLASFQLLSILFILVHTTMAFASY